MTDRALLVPAALAGALLIYQVWKRQAARNLTLPPSPRSYPFIGHLLSMPSGSEHLEYARMGEELGSSIISLTTLGTTIVVLNDAQDAIHLLEKRSAIYSDRKCPPMMAEPSLIDWEAAASLVGYNERWRTYRRLMNTWLHKKAAEGFHPLQTEEARLLLSRLLNKHTQYKSSKELETDLYRSVASTVLRSVYGYQPKNLDDPFLVRAKDITDIMAKAFFPSNFLVNAIPALMYVPSWFPGAGWKRKAQVWRKQKEDVIQDSYNWTKDQISKGVDNHTIIAAMIDQASNLGLIGEVAEDYIQNIAFTLWGGGTDTTISTLMGFFLAMLLFPNVKIIAQKEIDEVVGYGRLPALEDQAQLPYISRIVQEVLRWFPATPLAVPHVCFEDDIYKSYNIPKGAIVFGNVWAMTRDESVYKDPETFDPDRFLDPSVPLSPVFGWGRRRCPGVHLVHSSLFITIASFLATFEITLAQDESGNDIVPSRKVINGIVSQPEPFAFKLTPRSERHAELIRDSI